jgi:hypothetical protein
MGRWHLSSFGVETFICLPLPSFSILFLMAPCGRGHRSHNKNELVKDFQSTYRTAMPNPPGAYNV